MSVGRSREDRVRVVFVSWRRDSCGFTSHTCTPKYHVVSLFQALNVRIVAQLFVSCEPSLLDPIYGTLRSIFIILCRHRLHRSLGNDCITTTAILLLLLLLLRLLLLLLL